MDLEFDLYEQSSAHSDIFAHPIQEFIWRRIDIENKPIEVLLNIMKFLDIRDIFFVLNQTSREFNLLISKNSQFRKNLLKSVFKRSTGFALPASCKLEEETILKTLLKPSSINTPIPFYGYATNGGFDQQQEFWIDTAFIKGLWSICTKEGSTNVNIAGSTLADSKNLYSTYLKNHKAIEDMVCNICNYIKYNFNGDSFDFNYIKRTFHSFSLDQTEYLEKLYQIYSHNQHKYNHEHMMGLLKISIDLYQKISLSKTLNLPVQEKVIEDQKTLLCDKTVNILTGVQISREGFFNCPVRTLMIFGSNKRINVDKNNILDSYNDITFDEKLENIINKKDLHVVDTNVRILRSQTSYFDDEQTEFKFAIFSNQYKEKNEDDENTMEQEGETEDEQDLIPIAWVQYTAQYIDYISLQFRKLNYFNCKHVAVKLIDCDNRIKETEKLQCANIDFNYIQFKGMQMKLN